MTLALHTFIRMVASFGVHGPMPGSKPKTEPQPEEPEDGDEEETSVKLPKVSASHCSRQDVCIVSSSLIVLEGYIKHWRFRNLKSFP